MKVTGASGGDIDNGGHWWSSSFKERAVESALLIRWCTLNGRRMVRV